MAQQYIYQMRGLKKFLGNGDEILKGIWLSFYPGAKIGVIGANGAGKSSVLKVMAGIDTDIQGETWIDPHAKVGYLAQEPQLDPTLTVRGNIELAVKGKRDIMARYEAVAEAMGDPDITDDQMDKLITEQSELQDVIDAQNLWDLDRSIEIAMDALRVPNADQPIDNLSGGERRRVALCRLLMEKPDLLLLDEPTNHLDAESVAWLERTLAEYTGTIVLITHDRYFLDNVVKWILEMEGGKGTPWEGNYSSWLDQKQKASAQQEKRAKALQTELEWIRATTENRRTRNKARISRYEDILNDMGSYADERAKAEITIPNGPRLGNLVVRARGLRKAYGDRLLFENVNFDLPPGGIVGIIGPNGAGKTTLFRMIIGEEKPDEGTLEVGETVQLSYVNQGRDSLDDKKSVWDNISGGHMVMKIGKVEVNSRAYVSAFGFRGPRQQQLCGTLSGGERNRVHLSKLLQSGGNLILLDEPTNDLDVDTLRALEEALLSFAGCAVVISHDRWFLDRVATHILAFEGDSQVVWYEGSYTDYERDRRKRLGQDADTPHALRYKPITRS